MTSLERKREGSDACNLNKIQFYVEAHWKVQLYLSLSRGCLHGYTNNTTNAGLFCATVLTILPTLCSRLAWKHLHYLHCCNCCCCCCCWWWWWYDVVVVVVIVVIFFVVDFVVCPFDLAVYLRSDCYVIGCKIVTMFCRSCFLRWHTNDVILLSTFKRSIKLTWDSNTWLGNESLNTCFEKCLKLWG